MSGLHDEEFSPGRQFDHARTRTVAERDNVLFGSLTMNGQPLHRDARRSATTGFEPLVNSLFTLGMVIGTTVNDTKPGTTIANPGMTDEGKFVLDPRQLQIINDASSPDADRLAWADQGIDAFPARRPVERS